MSRRTIVPALALLGAIGAGSAVFVHETGHVHTAARDTFTLRVDLIERYLRLLGHNATALAAGIENVHAQMDPGALTASVERRIRAYPDHEVWGLAGADDTGAAGAGRGALTGSAALREPSPALAREMGAVLALGDQFARLLENAPELAWIAYTSAREFVYVVLRPPLARFHFSPGLYYLPYWSDAAPRYNPAARPIVSDLYNDRVGGRLVTSIAVPVTLDGEFSGVVSLDLTVEHLQHLTAVGSSVGTSILVGEAGGVIARPGDFAMNEEYAVSAAPGWSSRDGADWLATDVVPGELRLLHRLPHARLYHTAAWASVPAWSAMAVAVLLVALSVRTNVTLAQVRSLVHRDPLTGLANRRGCLAALGAMRERARRDGRGIAVLVLDLDHFKQVNDTHGHDAGDQVLVVAARRLMGGTTADDLVCRWGGEEVLVLIAHERSASPAAIAERLRHAIADTPFLDGRVEVTTSGGLTALGDDEELEVAVSRADTLLYRAKAAGRNRIEDDMDDAGA